MKNELKLLYKKNPKLALQVAKVLGYRIKADPAPKVSKGKKIRVLNWQNGLPDMLKVVGEPYEVPGMEGRIFVTVEWPPMRAAVEWKGKYWQTIPPSKKGV